jgi:diadenosine tetraphosphate (Ap4A) HIT family hydrolase
MGDEGRKNGCSVPRAGCLACELSSGVRKPPGGCIYEAEGWRVEHCVGPLGVGTLVVKPIRHVLHVADLTAAEASAFGPLLWRAAQVVSELSEPMQVYVSLWSSGPVHIHWVVQPISLAQESESRGPFLQAAMFAAGKAVDVEQAALYAERAREAWPP